MIGRLSALTPRGSALLRCARSCAARAPQQACRAPARRQLCTAVAEVAEAESGGLRWLLKEGQVDSGFWQGTALLAAIVGAVQVSSEEQRKAVVGSLLQGYRTCGLQTEYVGDRALIEDFVRKNAIAACNVLMASPVFYFMFSRIYGQPISVCLVRSVTGSLRITPFMFSFYGFFALACPFATQMLMQRHGQTYAEAKGNGGLVIFPPLVFVEAIVELRGCGVTFGQMTASSFLIFVPALIGRLATGVLTQQQKVGVESESVLPADWQEGPTWQQHTYMTFEMLHLDKDFFTTAAGTSVFQHILNATTWVLLTQGRTATFGSIFKFMLGGMNGTVLSGAAQFGKTLILRSLFGWVWNFCSSQELDMPAFDTVLKGLPPNPAA